MHIYSHAHTYSYTHIYIFHIYIYIFKIYARDTLYIYIYIYIYMHLYKYHAIHRPCQCNRCQLSTAIVSSSCVTSTSNGRTFNCRNQGTNCNAKWAVYVIICDVCGMQYVGQANNNRFRMNGHKQTIDDYLMGIFLNQIHHLFTVT